MIKLKSLITEQAVDKTTPFSLTDRDPYEYKLVDNIWYTKRKTATDWLDMKSKISSANYDIAVDRLNAFTKTEEEPKKSKVDQKKSKVEPKKSKVDLIPKVDFIPGLDQIDVKDTNKLKNIKTPVKQDLDIKQDTLAGDYKLQTNIVAKLYDMITKNPAKYFSRFTDFMNDNELGAATFFKNEIKEFEIKLNDIKNKDNEDIALNTKLIKNIMNDVYIAIKNNVKIKKLIQITDPTYKDTATHMRYNKYSATMWWQYFNN